MGATQMTTLQRTAYQVWLGVGLLALGYAAYRVFARPLGVLVPPLLVAVIVVYLLNPTVSGLQRRGVPRWAGTSLAFLSFIMVLGGIAALLIPAVVDQVNRFAEAAPEFSEQLSRWFNEGFAVAGLNIELGGRFDGEVIAAEIQQFLSVAENRDAALALLGGISGLATGLIHFVLAFLVGPVTAIYLLWDLPRIRAWAIRAVPPAYRVEAQQVGRRLSQVVGGYIRGQLLVATYVGVASSLGLAAIGLRYWLVVGLVAGVTNLVPMIGPLVAGLLGVAIALFTDGAGLAVLVVVVMTVVQQVDNHVVSPLVMGHTVRVHPLAVLLALLVGGTLFGVFGLFVAVPTVAAVNVLVAHAWQTRVPWAEPASKEARTVTGADSRHSAGSSGDSVPSDAPAPASAPPGALAGGDSGPAATPG